MTCTHIDSLVRCLVPSIIHKQPCSSPRGLCGDLLYLLCPQATVHSLMFLRVTTFLGQ